MPPRPADALAIVAMGACTPVGLTARMTQVERAARTRRFTLTEVRDRLGQEIRASRLTLLEPWRSRTERLAALGVTALEECLTVVKTFGTAPQRLPTLLVLPEEGVGAPWDEQALREALEHHAPPVSLEWIVGSWHSGRAGLFPALERARQLLRGGQSPWVLVGGVDSLSDGASLRRLVETGRCQSSEQRAGLLPGEGAGFVLLESAAHVQRRHGKVEGWVLTEAHGHEARHFGQHAPNQAEMLTAVLRQLRRHPVAGAQRVDRVLSCQTGEGYWANEFAQAYLRNAALFPEPLVLSEIAESLGEVGAAAGPLQVGYGLYLLRRLGGHRALVYGSSDGGTVGACVLEVPS